MSQNTGQPDHSLEALRAGIQARDESALRELLARLVQRLSRFGSLRGARLTEVSIDEIASEAVFLIWSRIATFDPARGSFTNWCDAVARHVAVSEARKASRTLPVSSAVPVELLPSCEKESETLDPTREAILRNLWAMLEALPEQDRRIIHAYLAGPERSWAVELSREMGLSPEAIRVRRFRIMQRMKAKCLRQYNTLLLGGPGNGPD